MNASFKTSPVGIDNVLSILVIAATVAFAGYAALASAVAPLAA